MKNVVSERRPNAERFWTKSSKLANEIKEAP